MRCHETGSASAVFESRPAGAYCNDTWQNMYATTAFASSFHVVHRVSSR